MFNSFILKMQHKIRFLTFFFYFKFKTIKQFFLLKIKINLLIKKNKYRN